MSSDTVKFTTSTLHFSTGSNYHLFLYWSSSDIILSSEWILGLTLSYAVCIYEIRYWVWPLPRQFEQMGSIGPHNYISKILFYTIFSFYLIGSPHEHIATLFLFFFSFFILRIIFFFSNDLYFLTIFILRL